MRAPLPPPTIFDIAEYAVAPIIVIDAEHIIRFASPSATSLFRGALVGYSIHHMVPESFRARHRSLIDGFIANPTSRSMQKDRRVIPASALDGTPLQLDIQIGPPPPQSGMAAVAFLYDLTEFLSEREQRHNAEQQTAQAKEAASRLTIELEAAQQRHENDGRVNVLRIALLGVLAIVFAAAILAGLDITKDNSDLFREVALFGMSGLGSMAAGFAIGNAGNAGNVPTSTRRPDRDQKSG
jgi:hypothetical protein